MVADSGLLVADSSAWWLKPGFSARGFWHVGSALVLDRLWALCVILYISQDSFSSTRVHEYKRLLTKLSLIAFAAPIILQARQSSRVTQPSYRLRMQTTGPSTQLPAPDRPPWLGDA